MNSAESLKRSLSVAEELRSVVKTMKALAGINVRAYERSAHAVAEYNRTVEMGLQIALQQIESPVLPARRTSENRLGAIVFGSDQGMCGLLNDQVVSHVTRALKKLAVGHAEQFIVAVGARAAAQLEARGREVEAVLRVPTSVAGIGAAVEEILKKIDEWRTVQSIGLVTLFHARPVPGGGHRVLGTRLLPLDAEWIRALKARPWPGKVNPMFTMHKEELFQALVREYLFASLFRALAESLVSENSSRLDSMQAAEHNIDDRLRALTMEARQVRQSAITSELLDIISSFEALRGKSS